MKNVLTGFKDFISRGNVMDLAVAVVIGAAFGAVVKALVDGIISPLIGIILGSTSLVDVWKISLGDGELDMGLVLDAILQFVLIAAAVYFLIVVPLNRLAARRKKGLEPEPAAPAEDILLLQEIRDLLAGGTNPAMRRDTDPKA